MFGLQGARRSRLLQPLWVCASTPSHCPSLVLASPQLPRRSSLARFGCRQFPGSIGTRGGGAEDVLVSGGPGISTEATEGEEAARERQKEQFTEKHAHSLSLETFLKFKGCKWRPVNGGTPLPASLPQNAQVSGRSRRREPGSAGRQFCGFLTR